ncbi:hypothetical protein L9F63_006980 [Diploptera punctata]|uniref:Guided entry of tail-anchored proteins factor 1 n=1 Tax=Diploptera punctata TaxID=6984 RepID=A0AAD7Z9X5_DIPPU|nr:hypothetical protein L9F63_006980 [Diploptera punctata]
MPLIIKSFLSIIFMETRQELELKAETIAVRREMSEISMVDEFARHARLQRKLNKLQEEIKYLANFRMSETLKFKVIATYTSQILMGLGMLYLIWSYKYVPVIVLLDDWLYPLGRIFQWPTGVEGAVSISNWFIITGTVAKLTAGTFK